ncbi:MAG: alanyl-tRNA editing protein [Deltaproteobacteria bacterium]
MATPRLYFDDPALVAFDARVIAHGTWQGRPSIVLDRTAFYPEAGGQNADHGVLHGLRLLDVQVDDDGVVHHVADGALPAVGTEVHSDVDVPRRRLHRALHTGQHMLSRALIDEARAETVSSRLGETSCTIDVDRDSLDEAAVARAEDLVNAIIDADVAVRAFFPTADELRALPLRRAPKVTENIRVVDVAGFDVSPCGGTHCTQTSQVGLVKVTGLERYKGKMRVSFAAGKRARVELFTHSESLRALARELTCGVSEVKTGLDRLRRELADAREALGLSRAQLAEHAAASLWLAAQAAGSTRVVATFDEGGTEFLRAVGARVTSHPGAIAMLSARSADGLAVLVARGEGSTFDCGAFLKRAAAASGGRGGGRVDRAEGKVPTGADWAALVAQHAEV